MSLVDFWRIFEFEKSHMGFHYFWNNVSNSVLVYVCVRDICRHSNSRTNEQNFIKRYIYWHSNGKCYWLYFCMHSSTGAIVVLFFQNLLMDFGFNCTDSQKIFSIRNNINRFWVHIILSYTVCCFFYNFRDIEILASMM